jgi:hypothetical protein
MAFSLNRATLRLFQFLSGRSPASVLFLSIFLVLLAGWIDYVTGVEVSLSILYLLPVSMGAWFVGRRVGVVLSFLGSATWFLADFFSARTYSHPLIPYWNALVMFGFFLITAVILSTLRVSLERERRRAHEIQEWMLPQEIRSVDGYQIARVWKPAEEVGGDYYDILKLGDSAIGLCVADVIGHGMPAALLMSNLQAAVRLLASPVDEASRSPAPSELCARANAFVCRNVKPGGFITFFYAVLDLSSGKLRYANAGHNPPLIARKDGELVKLVTGDFPLGLRASTSFHQSEIGLRSGDVLLLYTDGVVEAADIFGEQLGEERLIEILRTNRHLPASQLADAILNSVHTRSKNTFQDDVTMLVLTAP